jgi:hypothetical protein
LPHILYAGRWTEMQDYCLEPTKNQAPKISRFTNPIFNDIDLMLTIGTRHHRFCKFYLNQDVVLYPEKYSNTLIFLLIKEGFLNSNLA